MARVLVFSTVSGTGGIQRNARELTRLLLDSGCQVLILSSVLGVTSAGDPTPDENDELLKGGAQIFFMDAKGSLLGRIKELTRLRRVAVAFRPDILWGAGTSWHLGLLAMMLGPQVRRIFHEVMSGELDGARDARWLVRWFFDEVVGQSPRVAAAFASSSGWKRKLSAIPAYPEPLEITARLPAVSRRSIPVGSARAAFFSRLVEGKQALWLVRQWDELKTLVGTLSIHGEGPERPAIETLIAEKDIGEQVKCFGRYPDGQAYADLLSSYDLILLPTIFPEGAPLVLLEAMACGVPFIANGMGGIPDYAEGNPDCCVSAKQSEFIVGVRTFVNRLATGEIDQGRLQRHYLRRYSRAALDEEWAQYLGLENTKQ
jgi:glycosyltransferase involved in cell wall biosynthesis